jgi:hypothetical protein
MRAALYLRCRRTNFVTNFILLVQGYPDQAPPGLLGDAVLPRKASPRRCKAASRLGLGSEVDAILCGCSPIITVLSEGFLLLGEIIIAIIGILVDVEDDGMARVSFSVRRSRGVRTR